MTITMQNLPTSLPYWQVLERILSDLAWQKIVANNSAGIVTLQR